MTETELYELFDKYNVQYKNKNLKIKSILKQGNSENINKLIPVLQKEGIDVIKCPTILAMGKYDEVKKLIELIKKEQIEIKKCPSILAFGKYDEVNKLIELLKKEQIEIKKCPSILAFGKYDEVKKLIELIKKEQIEIKKCPSILAFGKYQNLIKIKEILKSENIKFSNIFNLSYYKAFINLKVDDYERILTDKNSKNVDDIKIWLKLKGYYSKFYNIEELESICIERKIDLKYLLVNVLEMYYEEDFLIGFNNFKKDNKKIWIGENYPLSKKVLEEYKQLILDVSISLGKSMSKILNFQDCQGYALDIIMERCGSFFNNYYFDDKIIKRCLYKYCVKSIHSNNNSIYMDTWKKHSDYNDQCYEDETEEVFLDVDFNDQEQEIINRMNKLLSLGYSIDSIKQEFDLSDELYDNIMRGIKEKLLSKVKK